MRKPTIITAYDNNKTYSSFVDVVRQFWEQNGYEIKITHIDKPIKDIHPGVQAKITRMIMACEEDFFQIVDVDMFILNLEFIQSQHNKYNDKDIYAEEYYTTDDTGKWPMWSNFGSGKLLKSIINPNNLNYNDLIESWKLLTPKYDKKELVTNDFDNFSDESLMRRLFLDAGYKHKIYRRMLPNMFNYHINSPLYYKNIMRRVDRHWNWSIDKEFLYDKKYIDCFPRRPLNKRDPMIQILLKYLKL